MGHSSETQARIVVDPCAFYDDKGVAKYQAKYVEYFKNSPGPILDLGCGHGIMLQFLKNAGIECYGVERFHANVDICKGKGLPAVQCDALTHLGELDDESVGGIFCAHLIEHFIPPDAVKLCHEAFRVVRPGGAFIIITPEPRDLNVMRGTFWLDITHVRPYPGQLVRQLLSEVGYQNIEILHDRDTRYSPGLRKGIEFIRKVWFWQMINLGDLVVVARK